MTRHHRLTLAALLASAVLLAAGASWAQDPQPGDPPGPHGGDGMRHGPAFMQHQAMMEKLNLTDDQTKKLEDIRYQHQKKAITMRADLESARLDLGRMMRADQPDRRAIETQLDKIGQARVTLEKDRVAQLLEMRAILTPEQLKTWRQMHGGMRGGMHGGMPRMMHGGGPGMWHDGPGGAGGGSGESMMLGEPGLDDPGDDSGLAPDDGPPGH
jgi:Spy/CpxP family protein refolding chaperone